MQKLTQAQHQTIFLYSKGLTFKEIDNVLKIHSKAYYSQVLQKDKGRVTRAKISRQKNKRNYQVLLDAYIEKVKQHNKYFKNCSHWIKEQNIISLSKAKIKFRYIYMIECLNKSHQSYSRNKITLLKKYHENVA